MMVSPRYAIYYVPAADDPIGRLGAEWLGRDAFLNRPVDRRPIPGLAPGEIDRLTTSPRRYGFHATLKAPFHLRDGLTEGQLFDAFEAFAAQQTPFSVSISPAILGQFLALRLTAPSEEMDALHAESVRCFEAYRAPLSQADIERRRQAELTPQQDTRLLDWGYPYIFDDFRWHMTLTNRIIADSTRTKVLTVLNELFRDVCQFPHWIDGVALCSQPDRDAPFRIVKHSRFQGGPAGSRNTGAALRAVR